MMTTFIGVIMEAIGYVRHGAGKGFLSQVFPAIIKLLREAEASVAEWPALKIMTKINYDQLTVSWKPVYSYAAFFFSKVLNSKVVHLPL